jgi:N-methylhydantoinase A/oxoprolinase/acetone carboxylase beta subunit
MAETRLGIELGPTRAVAVVLDGAGRVLARAAAGDLRSALAELSGPAPELVVVDAGDLAIDALQPGRVARVAVVRIGAPLTLAVPPLATWPPPLRAAVSAGTAVVAGGVEHDGTAARLDEAAIARFLAGARPDSVAVTGLFAPIAPEQELAAAEVARRTLGRAIPVTLSHEIGTLGLLERENATVLNAALTGVFDDLASALSAHWPALEPYLARGDGTLMALTPALGLPVTAIGSGAASALQGAFRLTGLDDAVVALADRSIVVGALRNGLAREAPGSVQVAGVSIGLRLADTRAVPDPAGLEAVVARFAAGALGPVLVAVGGASELVSGELAGVAQVIHPPHGELVRAVGAAFGLVGGEAEFACLDRAELRQEAQREARAAAFERAVHHGADPNRVEVVDVEETPLATLPEPTVRIRVRAAGPP